MTGWLERVRGNDPSVLEELGHELLPFVQTVLLAQHLAPREPSAVLQAFRTAIATAAGTATEDAALAPAVIELVRAAGAAIPPASPDQVQDEARKLLERLQPLPVPERELVVARFVERLPGKLVCDHYRLELPALATILARGVTLLISAAQAGPDWVKEPSLTDPDAAPALQLVELENLLTALAIDVTALELEPLNAAFSVLPAPPALKPGHQPQSPAESYPSQVHTQQASNLPVQASRLSVSDEPTHTAATPLARPAFEITSELARPAFEITAEIARPGTAVTAEVPRPGTEVTTEMARPGLDVTREVARPPPVFSSETTVGLGAVTTPRPAPEVTPLMASPRVRVADEVTALAASALPRRRRRGGPALFVGAAACALVAVGMYQAVLGKLEKDVGRGWTLNRAAVVTRDLSPGTVLTSDLVAIRALPEGFVTSSVVAPDALQSVIGQRLAVAVQAGDPLRWGQLEAKQTEERLAPKVGRKQRAISIKVSELKSVGGWVHPGEQADLVLAMSDPESPGRASSTVIQDVHVLAIGAVSTSTVAQVRRKSITVSLLVAPEDAERVALATREGAVTMSLRKRGTSDEDNDHERRAPSGTTTIGTLNDREELQSVREKRQRVVSPPPARP